MTSAGRLSDDGKTRRVPDSRLAPLPCTEQLCTAASQISPPSPPSCPVWEGTQGFHNSCYLMFFFPLDLSRAGGVSSNSRHNYQISSPLLRSPTPCSRAPRLPILCGGCHTEGPGLGFIRGGCTCAPRLTLCVSTLGYYMVALKCHCLKTDQG